MGLREESMQLDAAAMERETLARWAKRAEIAEANEAHERERADTWFNESQRLQVLLGRAARNLEIVRDQRNLALAWACLATAALIAMVVKS